MAWFPSSCHPVHRCLWIPDLREGDDSPLRTSFRRSAPATYPTPQLPTPRILPCGLNGTSQTRSPPCAEGSSLLSLVAYHAARAAAELRSGNTRVKICNAVVLTTLGTAGHKELSGDILLKKPFRLSPTAEFMLGAGPSFFRPLNGSERGNSTSIEFALDWMFWPTKDLGWFIEPT